jgi:hypothetical protein
MMTNRRSTLITWATVIAVAVGAYWTWDMLLQRPGLGGVGSGVGPPPANSAEPSVELADSVAATLKVEAVEEREFPIEKEAVGSIDFKYHAASVYPLSGAHYRSLRQDRR